MANKFTKGILERQEREYKKQKSVSLEPISTPDNIPKTPISPLEEQAETAAPQITPAKTTKPSKTPAPKDLSAYIVRKDTRNAKNKTFYLDETVILAIKRAATSQQVAESKLVNDILKKILIP